MGDQLFDTLDNLYRSILLRPLDPSGFQTYSKLLQCGEATVGEIENILRESAEYKRLCDAIQQKTVYEVPHRSPLVVSDAISDLLSGRRVCEIGCAEGDNMISLGRHADHVIGFECDPLRCQQARNRGLDVVQGDFWQDSVPAAEVYFIWLTDGGADNEPLLSLLLEDESFQGKIILAADSSIAGELISIRRCARWGETRAVAYDEGVKERQKGIVLLAIIDADRARELRNMRHRRERRVITTLAVGRDLEPLMAVTLPSIENYADAIGADLSIITLSQINDPSPFYEIFQIRRLFHYYERIIYIDLDVVVRDGAPDLFDIVPEDHLGVFMESRMQTGTLVDFYRTNSCRLQSMESVPDNPSEQRTLVADCFNNGVTVMSARHRYLFEMPVDITESARGNDQAIMNLRAHGANEKIYDISERFNYMVSMLDSEDQSYSLSAWMIHYGALPMAIKIVSARRDIERWQRRDVANEVQPHRNRLFYGIVLKTWDGTTLEADDNDYRVVNEQGLTVFRLNRSAALLWQFCNGIHTLDEVIDRVASISKSDIKAIESQVVDALTIFLNLGLVGAVNQYSPESREYVT